MDCSLPGFSVHGILQGKNTGVGCHFLLQCMKVKSESEVAQLCLTLSDPMDRSLPGSSIHGIFQATVLEWDAIAFSVYRVIDNDKVRTDYSQAICFSKFLWLIWCGDSEVTKIESSVSDSMCPVIFFIFIFLHYIPEQQQLERKVNWVHYFQPELRKNGSPTTRRFPAWNSGFFWRAQQLLPWGLSWGWKFPEEVSKHLAREGGCERLRNPNLVCRQGIYSKGCLY